MFQAIRKVTLNAQLGPFETFEELQAAASREMPGTVLIRGNAASGGEVKDANGFVSGKWTMPYQLLHPVTHQALTGPVETFEELQVAIAKEAPGTTLRLANPKIDKHSGEVVDSLGAIVGKWTED
jgi:hypothetical protein